MSEKKFFGFEGTDYHSGLENIQSDMLGFEQNVPTSDHCTIERDRGGYLIHFFNGEQENTLAISSDVGEEVIDEYLQETKNRKLDKDAMNILMKKFLDTVNNVFEQGMQDQFLAGMLVRPSGLQIKPASKAGTEIDSNHHIGDRAVVEEKNPGMRVVGNVLVEEGVATIIKAEAIKKDSNEREMKNNPYARRTVQSSEETEH